MNAEPSWILNVTGWDCIKETTEQPSGPSGMTAIRQRTETGHLVNRITSLGITSFTRKPDSRTRGD